MLDSSFLEYNLSLFKLFISYHGCMLSRNIYSILIFSVWNLSCIKWIFESFTKCSALRSCSNYITSFHACYIVQALFCGVFIYFRDFVFLRQEHLPALSQYREVSSIRFYSLHSFNLPSIHIPHIGYIGGISSLLLTLHPR